MSEIVELRSRGDVEFAARNFQQPRRNKENTMLEAILEKKTCAACRFCCVFDATDIWEMPLVDASARAAAMAILPGVAFTQDGDDWRFAAPTPPDGVCVDCPARTPHGCALGPDRPFECRLWPIRALVRDGKPVLALSLGCKAVASLPDEIVAAHARAIAPKVAAYAAAHPQMLHPWHDDYRWLCDLPPQ